jgi:hypothetical protein
LTYNILSVNIYELPVTLTPTEAAGADSAVLIAAMRALLLLVGSMVCCVLRLCMRENRRYTVCMLEWKMFDEWWRRKDGITSESRWA